MAEMIVENFDESCDTTFKQHSVWSLRRWQARVPARVVLYFLSFSGFLVSFMMRTDINMAIVAMVRRPPLNLTAQKSEETLYCYSDSLDLGDGNISLGDQLDSNPKEEGEFNWDTQTQTIIISTFYWCYILSQVMGGVLSQKLGTKVVFGFSQLATAACSLLIPTAASINVSFLIALRSMQGIASGLTWPAMYAMVGQWIPPEERSRFMSSFQGFSFGIGLNYPLCGWLIANWGWRTVFYTTGSIGVVWCVFWLFLAYDTPASHPRITMQERRYIEASLGSSAVQGSKIPVPWKSIATSLPVWAIAIATFGRIWVSYTFIISGPLYMKTVLGFAIQKNGLLNGAPFLCSYLSSVIFCYLADVLVTRRIMTLTNVRKLNTALAQVVPGILVLAIGYLGCNIILVLIVWFIAVTFITAAYAGAMASIVDIAPNLAGPILAFTQTIHMSASFLSPLVAGTLLQDNQTLGQWRKVFGVTAVVAVGTYGMFQLFGTPDVQTWNYPDKKIPSSSLQPLADEADTVVTITTRNEQVNTSKTPLREQVQEG